MSAVWACLAAPATSSKRRKTPSRSVAAVAVSSGVQAEAGTQDAARMAVAKASDFDAQSAQTVEHGRVPDSGKSNIGTGFGL